MDSTLSQIMERVREAAATAAALRILGSGSKDFYGCSLQGQPLSTAELTGVVSYEPSELVVTVRAGTPLAQLQALLAGQGQHLAFEPFHGGPGATVGGMVACGLSGPARVSAGAVRDFVLGLEMVNGQGELLRYGGQVMKNVAGYDVSRLMVGSWGTLGLISEVSLKVLPVAAAQATLRFECDQAQALLWLNTWAGQPLPLNASLWRPGQDGSIGSLWVRLCGAQAAVQAACRQLGGQQQDPAQAQRQWQACREQSLDWFVQAPSGMVLWRLSLPSTAPPLFLPEGITDPLIEWHGGLRWLWAPRRAAAALREQVRALGGTASLFRGEVAGQASAGGDLDAYAQGATAQIHARIKQAFDPAGIFNRGRLTPAW